LRLILLYLHFGSELSTLLGWTYAMHLDVTRPVVRSGTSVARYAFAAETAAERNTAVVEGGHVLRSLNPCRRFVASLDEGLEVGGRPVLASSQLPSHGYLLQVGQARLKEPLRSSLSFTSVLGACHRNFTFFSFTSMNGLCSFDKCWTLYRTMSTTRITSSSFRAWEMLPVFTLKLQRK
jgi:hypothetical protein